MRTRHPGTVTAVSLGALALVLGLATVPAVAQQSPFYPSDRKVNDNGSVYEPGPGASPAARQSNRHEHLLNYQPQAQNRYYPSDRKLNDNGSVDEPGQGR